MFLGNKMQKYRPKEAVGKLLKKNNDHELRRWTRSLSFFITSSS